MFRFVGGVLLALIISAASVAAPPDAVDDTVDLTGNSAPAILRTDTLFSGLDQPARRLAIRLDDGGRAVIWDNGFDADYGGAPPANFSIYLQRYDKNGDQAGGRIDLLAGFDFSDVVGWSASRDLSGSAAILLVLEEDSGSGSTFSARHYDAAGGLVAGPVSLPVTDPGEMELGGPGRAGRNEILALSNGNIVLFAEGGASGDCCGIVSEVFTSTGTSVRSEFVVNTTRSNAQSNPSGIALPGGGFVLSWTDFSATAPDTSSGGTNAGAVRAQVFDNAGLAAGSEILVNTTYANGQTDPVVQSTADGGFLIV